MLVERAPLLKALTDARWVISEAARLLGVSRQTVYSAMDRHDIEQRDPPESVLRELHRRNGSKGGRPRKPAAA